MNPRKTPFHVCALHGPAVDAFASLIDVAAAATRLDVEAGLLAIAGNVIRVLGHINKLFYKRLEENIVTHLVAVLRDAVLRAVGVDAADTDDRVTLLELAGGVCGGRGHSKGGKAGEEAQRELEGLHLEV